MPNMKNGKGRGIPAPGRKSVKMEADDLMEKIKAAVKEAIGGEDEEEKDEAEGGDLLSVVEAALEMAEGKRKARKDDGEEVGELTPDEIMECVAELMEGEGKGDEDEGGEEKGDEDEGEEEKGSRKARSSIRQVKSAPAYRAPAQRKYSNIFISTGAPSGTPEQKKIPPNVQLARAVKCLDVFGRHDPEAAAFYAKKHYSDENMAREFKALSATNPSAGGFLIPEVYLDEIIELLYSKTVIFELGAQKVPMPSGNLNIPKMASGTRARWGGEARKIAKTQPGYGNIKLSAKRLEAIVPQTRELIMSTSYSADAMFANDLTRRMELGLDYGAMFGTGTEFQPLGIASDKEVEVLDVSKINDTSLVTDGKITADLPVVIRSKVLRKNVDDRNLGWTFNSDLEGYFMNMKTTTGVYIYREEMNGGKLLGFPFKVSNQISTNGGKTELIFGNWADLLIGEQLGLETYTTLDGSWTDEDGVQHNAFEENLAATRALMYVDTATRHKESFLHVTNIKTAGQATT